MTNNKPKGIPFKNGFPDFSEYSSMEIMINAVSANRVKNFAKADKKAAEFLTKNNTENDTCFASQIFALRKEKIYTWHEKEDLKTMQMMPIAIHGNIPHSGAMFVLKNND